MFSDNASLRKNECSKLFQTVTFYIDAHKIYVVQILLQTIYFSILLVISLSAILLSSVILLCAILILYNYCCKRYIPLVILLLVILSSAILLLLLVTLLCAILSLLLAILLYSNLHSVATQPLNWKGVLQSTSFQLKVWVATECKLFQSSFKYRVDLYQRER